jgi:hypothetical protein
VIEAANVELQATGNYLSLAIKNTGTIRATGLVENADGSVTLTGGEGDILNTGVVAALQKSVNGVEQGGVIDISGKNIRAEEGSLITASGQESGGKIKIQSKDTTMLAGRLPTRPSSYVVASSFSVMISPKQTTIFPKFMSGTPTANWLHKPWNWPSSAST